jgi:DNA repair protein RecN (Recombination protein N)
MLTHLSINNYALIASLEIEFGDGLTIITGETGAGKSILLGALSLILGQRADSQVLLDKTRKCVVEGTFRIKDYGLLDFFTSAELDYDDNTVIRREINQSGKSRAFINDTPVTLEVLKDLGEMLIDVHSQHKTLTLQDSKFQLAFIDALVKHDDLIEKFKINFNTQKSLMLELSTVIETERKSKADQDYYQFQFDELNDANLLESEQEELEKELELLNHSEEIKSSLSKAVSILKDGEYCVTSGIKDVLIIVNKISGLHPELNEIAKRFESCSIELKDIALDLEQTEGKIIYDPERINKINERLDIIYHLQQKHRVNSVKELIEIKNCISDKLNAISLIDSKIEELKKQLSDINKILAETSSSITAGRKKTIPTIEKGILAVLKKLAMQNAEFKISLTQLEDYNQYGKDSVKFMFNANKGGDLKELSKVASGGEFSRLMLSIKSLVSEKKLLPTIILDEIDQGVSGDIADKVGNIMKEMSGTMQVIAITHLPQIAVKGTAHLLVYKESDKKSTYTRITALKDKERISEIAKMLSGNELTKAALENAKALLKN